LAVPWPCLGRPDRSKTIAKDFRSSSISSGLQRHVFQLRNNDEKDQTARRLDRGLRTIRDDLISGLPAGYDMDPLSDPCVIILRRTRKTLVAPFTRFADSREISRTAEEDRSNAESEPDS
jgi:hypothetical protein